MGNCHVSSGMILGHTSEGSSPVYAYDLEGWKTCFCILNSVVGANIQTASIRTCQCKLCD